MILKLYRSIAQRFKTFTNRYEMNEHVQAHVYAAGKKLHKNARSILDLLAKHSCKYGGVSWLSESTIAKKLDIHTDTVKRAIKRLQELRIGRVEVVEVSGITLSYFVLNRFEISEDLLEVEGESSLTASRDEATLEVDETKEATETKDQVISKNVSYTLDASYTPSNVPKEFAQAVQPFFNDAKVIYSLWQKVLISYRKLNLSVSIDDLVDTAVSGIKQSIFMLKTGRLRKDIGGYFYGLMYRSFTVIKRQQVEMYNWLEA